MVIQFQCVACEQPIEVDDDWALKRVACPYCRKTITAPAESEMSPTDELPVASPQSRQDHPQQVENVATGPPQTKNTLAKVALGLALAVVVQMMASASILAEHKLEVDILQDSINALAETGMSFWEAYQKASIEFYEQYGGLPPKWMQASGLLMVGAGLTWLAATICGLISVIRRDRGRLGWMALAIAGILPIFFCGGMFAS